MRHDDNLTLPEPARALWLATREPIRRALAQLDPNREWRLGGGTILAARWGHRLSFDIDIQIDEHTPLGKLEKEGFRWLQQETAKLGGTPIYQPELNFYTLRFGNEREQREVQIWSHKLPLADGHRVQKVEGNDESVLSTAQILRGKLERSSRKLGRDVYDLAHAAGADAKSLEIAVNTLPRSTVANMSLDWVVGYGRIGNDAHAQIRGAPGLGIRECYELGKRGAQSLLHARYAAVRLGVENERIVIDTVTEGGNSRRLTLTADQAKEQFAATGLNQHLRDKEPGPQELLDYAIELTRKKTGDILVFEEKNGEPTRWRTATRGFCMAPISQERPRRLVPETGKWIRDRSNWWRR